MEKSPQALWAAFQSSFRSAVESIEVTRLAEIWATQKTRTAHYADEILKSVAKDLDLHFRREYLRVDYSMWDRHSSREETPVIFIESENIATSAEDEVKILCSVAAPLKVLITVAQWEDVIPRWPTGGQRSNLMTRWRSIRSAYQSTWSDPGVFGVLVGESDNDGVLRFHAFELDTGSGAPTQDRVLFRLPTEVGPIVPAAFSALHHPPLVALHGIDARGLELPISRS